MYFTNVLIFSFILLVILLVYKVYGNKYSLAKPDTRKKHNNIVPQIGGIIFGPVILFFCWSSSVVPNWYIIGGLITIILGAWDDAKNISWKSKLFVQICIASFIANIFWGQFEYVEFFNNIIPVSHHILFAIFLIWFVGIFNAVNLVDGLDGLAGGFMLIVSLGLALISDGNFYQLNILLSIILLGFLVYNQRPAKLFMGDSGSLFLGYHTAVLPILFSQYLPISGKLIMTPFILITFYLIADTTRVFFTRIINNKSPMTADTIHFHHLVLQQSGSYLASITSIFFAVLISVIFALISFNFQLSNNSMLFYFSILLLFILMPPVQTYVPIIKKIVGPFFIWQEKSRKNDLSFYRTLLSTSLLILLLSSLLINNNLLDIINWQFSLAFFILLAVILLLKNDKIIIYVIQLFVIITFFELSLNNEIDVLSKLFSTLLNVTLIVFTIEKRIGCNISDFSSLDILIIIICFGVAILSLIGFSISFWIANISCSLWFSISFLFNRTIFYKKNNVLI